MKALLLKITAATLFAGSLSAQDVPPKHFRFIPLGELPVWKEELKDGIRVGLAPPKGSMPPKDAAILSGDAPINLSLNLRAFTELVTISGDTPGLMLKQGKLGAQQDWFRSKMPTSTLSLGILYRDPANMTWEQPKMLLLNDTASAFPAGTVRFANVSDRNVLVQIGNPNARPTPRIFGVKPGQSTSKPLKVGNNQIRVGYLAPGNRKVWIWTNQVRMLQNQRLQAFFYKTQGGAEARQPVKFHFTPELIPRLPQKPAN